MNKKGSGTTGNERSFSFYLTLLILLLIGAMITGITTVDYISTRQMFEEQQDLLHNQTENDIRDALYLADAGLMLYDDTYNQHMGQKFTIFMEEYNRSGGDPSRMDLALAYKKINEQPLLRAAPYLRQDRYSGGPEEGRPEIDLYVINESGVIVFTTNGADKGLDFSSQPAFYQYLGRIRNMSGMFPDRIVRDEASVKLHKFAYMPTADHRYILELGLSGAFLQKERGRIQFQGVIGKILSRNPFVKDFAVYDFQSWDVTDPEKPFPVALSGDLARVISTREDTRSLDTANRTVTDYLVVDLRSDRYGSDPSLIVKITYDMSLIDTALSRLLLERVLWAVVLLIIGAFFAVMIGRFLGGPVEGIVSDIDRIAGGDLDHPVASARGAEFSTLTRAITAMVGRLKETIVQLSKSEQALAISEKRYRAVSEIITDYAYSGRLNDKGVITLEWGSGAFEKITGFTYQEALLKGWWLFLAYPPDKEVVRAHNQSILENRPKSSEFRIVTRSGDIRWISHRSVPESGERGDAAVRFIAAGQDITDRKQAEEEVRKVNEELEERVRERTADLTQANRELEAFSYTVSHDLRGPLRAIDGFSRILSETMPDPEQSATRDLLMRIRTAAQEMGHLIDGLLDFSRLGRKALAITDVDVRAVVQKTIEIIEPSLRERRVVITTGDLPPCRADPSLIRHVFFNLIDNAVKYSRNREEARVWVGSEVRNGRLHYVVRDNGIGFDMKYADQIFGVFSRLHPPGTYEGTGVGLAIVKRIVERHGGTIFAESVPGEGSAFFFTLGP